MTRPVGLIKALVMAFLLAMGITEALAEDASAAPRAAMADAMSRMMEAMGLFNAPATPGLPMASPLSPLGGMPGGGIIMPGMPGASTWPATGGDPSGLMEKGGDMMKGFSEGLAKSGEMAGIMPWSSGSKLDGVWEGRNGELLIVQGNRFRIYPGDRGYVDGYLQASGERLAMYNPKNAQISPFEFAESGGRLVLRDDAGALYLYRRLWLEPAPSELTTPSSAASPAK
jgi:hypothetical protein